MTFYLFVLLRWNLISYTVNFNPYKMQKELSAVVVNKAKWLGNPANIKGTNRDAKIYVGRFMTVQNFVLRSYTMHELRNQHISIG